MAQAGPQLARRSLFGAMLAAPVFAYPIKASALPALRPGNIWIQVPEQAWTTFKQCVRDLEAFPPRPSAKP